MVGRRIFIFNKKNEKVNLNNFLLFSLKLPYKSKTAYKQPKVINLFIYILFFTRVILYNKFFSYFKFF